MNTLRLIALLLLAICFRSAHAQIGTSAEDFFNTAARQYVKESRMAALRTLDQALRQYPDDVRLRKLAEELLKEQQQEQEKQQQQDQQKKDDKQDKKEQKPDEKKDKPEQREQKEEKESARRVDPRDAQRLLDALDQQEKAVQQKVRLKKQVGKRVPTEKDW